MKKIRLSSLIVLLVISMPIWSQDKNEDATIFEVLEKQGKAFIKDKKSPSVSIGIYKNGKKYTRHFGELTKGKGNTPKDKTLYEIGSVTKPMTGYLLAKAVLEDKINLSDPVSKYLDGDYANLSFQGNPVTIKHLVTHTAGLPIYFPLAMEPLFKELGDDVPKTYLQLEETYSKAAFLEDLKLVQLTTKPGTNYAYSNVGADLLGHVLENVYKTDIDALLKEQLFDPAGMVNSGIHLSEEESSELVQGYWKSNDYHSPNQINKLWATGSGAKATLNDMLQFISFQLESENPSLLESQKVLFEGEKLLKVGYFWRVWEDKYGRSFNHHGGTTGMQNWLFIFPKYKMGISIITNQSGPKTPGKLSATVKKIMKALVKA